ncbi:hypothetical protein [Halosimplex sp. TS25]|uniref:DUF7344 domain-containing protein n=1 Tax=Halosimplex rarum TaxID=3396619 RepID=UPI0039E8139E
MDSQSTPSERDALFAILADSSRRRLLDALGTLEPGSRTTLSALSDRFAADDGPAGDEQRRDAAVALHHIHLPKLADAGLIEYDAEAKVVEVTGRSGERPDPAVDIPIGEE